MIGISGIASAMARKCAYKPSCVGLLYQGATCSMASAPRSRARCEYSIAAAVELLPVPAITRARPRATSTVIADDALVFSFSHRGALAGSAARHQQAHAAGDLPVDQRAQAIFINRAIGLETESPAPSRNHASNRIS